LIGLPARPPEYSEAVAARVARQGSPPKLSARVKVVNGPPTRRFIRRRDAMHFLETGRAVCLGRDPDGRDQIRLVEGHPNNQPRVVPGYDDIKNGFEWAVGTSNGAAVMKATRGLRRPEVTLRRVDERVARPKI
jgi:hypothetical protein